MNYELVKNEIIKLKKEELAYIDNISKTSLNKIFSEYEKLEIYRNIKNYVFKLNELFKTLWKEYPKDEKYKHSHYKEIIIEFEVDKDFLSSVNFYPDYYKNYRFKDLWITPETYKFTITLDHLYYVICKNSRGYEGINPDIILNDQKLMEEPIYIFCGYYDHSEDCYGPCFGEPDNYLEAIYEDVFKEHHDELTVFKKNMEEFEKDKKIIRSKTYVYNTYEIKEIFKEELLNTQNKSLNDCVIKTQNRIDELNYIRSPEYKEKILLEKINKLYEKVKGEFIEKEILYSGKFLDLIKETYKLPNKRIVEKEKVIKNGGKNSVIIVPLTQDKEYIITLGHRIKDKIIAEFPSGYIENNEDPIEAAKRELLEETGYTTDYLFVADKAYTCPGIDNSTTYIVIANNCIKTNEQNNEGTELVSYGLFTEPELKYMINQNIINGAMNKLAYYNSAYNVDNCNVTRGKQKIYKMQLEKKNPLDD